MEEYESEESMTTTKASVEDVEGTTCPRIRGRRRDLQRHDDKPKDLATTTEASTEEDDPEDLKKMM